MLTNVNWSSPASPLLSESSNTKMEEQQQPNPLAPAFPTPPPFWQQFTPENIARIEELREEQHKTESKPATSDYTLPPRLLDLPAELRCLQPPEPPVNGKYRCFGDYYDVRTSRSLRGACANADTFDSWVMSYPLLRNWVLHSFIVHLEHLLGAGSTQIGRLFWNGLRSPCC